MAVAADKDWSVETMYFDDCKTAQWLEMSMILDEMTSTVNLLRSTSSCKVSTEKAQTRRESTNHYTLGGRRMLNEDSR